MALFLIFMVGQTFTGFVEYNKENEDHDRPAVSLGQYLVGGHFWEATAENWESEFLQMAMFVVLTVCLRQKGSPESNSLDEDEEVDEDPRAKRNDPRAPWPVRKGGFVLWLFSHSLASRSSSCPAQLRRPRMGGRQSVFRGANRARREWRHDPAIHGNEPVLVRVVSELAERVPVTRSDGVPRGFPA